MSEISKSDLGIIEERLPVVIDQFENFNHIGSGTFSKVYVANIKVGFIDSYFLCYFHALIARVSENLFEEKLA